ncbi:hypothetical protein COCON_G00210030 [Conger conger]|uniref:Uncharacterized protein n=1 Tax=Conger conger TaxID=82655 RepID=A0A9Q1HQQ0_CONCO|nr:hypothetical protein COCON_G00210030 [Conger conger]
MSTSGSSDGDSGSPPVDCDPEYEDTLKVFGQGAEVAPGGLECSQQEPAPLYVEILPDQTTATQVSHLGRSTSFTLQPKPPAPMHHRTKSDSEPLSRKPAWFLLRLDQQNAKRGAKKPLHSSIRRPCPERPPPPTFTLNPGDDRPPLQKQMSTSGSSDDCDPQDGESTTPPVDCDSVYEDSLKFFEEAAESTSTKVSHLGRSTSLVTLKPKPPVPVQRTKSEPEPKPRTPVGLQLNLDQQKSKEGAKWQEPWHACDQRPRPERPPPPNYTLKCSADRPPLKKQMSTSGSSDGCDPPDGDSGTPPVVHDSHYDSKSPPVSCETQYDSKSPPVSCETQYDSKSPPVSSETQYDSKTPPVGCETQYDSKTPPVGCETQSEDRKTPPGAFVDDLKMSSPHSSASVPPLPPRVGLSDSVIGQGHTYLELTASTEAPTRKAVHDFFSKRPLPPVPHQQPQPEPLYEELTSCSCVTSGDSAERKPEDYEVLMAWWHTVDHWDNMPLDCELSEEEEMRVFALTAYRIKMGLRLFDCLLSRNGQSLQDLLTELDAAADGLDKTRKKAKMVTMTGGTTGAVGGVLTVAGLALAPMTLGASLVVSAVGVGVATAGGLTGASAAFSSKVSRNLDRKNVERIVLDFWDEVFDIERCLQFVNAAMEWLGRQDPARLTAADGETGAVVRLATVARSNRSSIQTADQSLEILWQFSQDIDDFFASGEAQKLKKGTEKQFAERIRSLAQQLREGLDSLMRIREILSLAASTTGVYEDLSA